jgi:hypothetical protein
VISINQPIVGYSVLTEEDKKPKPPAPLPQRESVLSGKTYKIKSPSSDSALYVTINDHDGRPFEIFVNSKDTRHFQWVTVLTRVMSAVFRKGGDCAFLIDELRSIFDPNGGYFKKGKFMPSLVAEIGEVLETHFTSLGLYAKDDSLAVAAKAIIEEKLASSAEDKMMVCPKCNQKSAILMDGCLTCTNIDCLHSKCG